MSIVTLEDQQSFARRVVEYWHKKGAVGVKCWAELEVYAFKDDGGFRHTQLIPIIKSNLVNGMPPL